MRRIPAIIACILCVAGCAKSTPDTNRRLITFYQQAVKRSKSPESNQPIDWLGLKLSDGTLAGCPRFPNIDESSIIVSDPDPNEHQAVQVIVSPRVSGSFADPAVPSQEFLRQQAEDREDALRKNRYTGVFLLAKPQLAEQVATSNGDKPSN
jgi:hypothetical protein